MVQNRREADLMIAYPLSNHGDTFAALRRTVKASRLLYRLRYTIALLYFAFFLPNTLFSPLNSWMIAGRWFALFAILGIILLTAGHIGLSRAGPGLSSMYTLVFFLILFTFPFSVNPVVSVVKWMVVLAFLVSSLILSNTVRTKADIWTLMRPLAHLVIAFLWLMPIASFIYPWSPAGFRGFMQNPHGVGALIAFFGFPVVLYALGLARTQTQRAFLTATLGLEVLLLVASRSRTATFITFALLLVGLWRYRGMRSPKGLFIKVVLTFVACLFVSANSEKVRGFVLKYEGSQALLESRTRYWDATWEAFLERPWTGAGFGLQATHTTGSLGFSTGAAGASRKEQGSSYLGVLEEVGIVGSTPIFLVLLAIAFKYTFIILRTRDPLRLFLSRCVLAGVVWGVTENYMFALGAPSSILFYSCFFMNERLGQIQAAERALQRHRREAMRFRRRQPSPAVQRTIHPGSQQQVLI